MAMLVITRGYVKIYPKTNSLLRRRDANKTIVTVNYTDSCRAIVDHSQSSKNKERSSWGRRAFFNAQRLKNLHFVRVVKMHLPRGVSEVTFLPHRAYIAFKALDRCETQSFFSWDRHCQLRMYCSKCGLIRLLKRPVVSKVSGIHFLMLFQEERHEIILF